MFWQIIRSCYCCYCCETEEKPEENFIIGKGGRQVAEAQGKGRRTELYGSFEKQRRLAQPPMRDADYCTVGVP